MAVASSSFIRRAHTAPIDPHGVTVQAALFVTRQLLDQRRSSIWGLAVDSKDDLEGLMRGALRGEIIEKLGCKGAFEQDGITIQLLTNENLVPTLDGPILAVCIDPRYLRSLEACDGVTEIIFVPCSANDLKAYLATYSQSIFIKWQVYEPMDRAEIEITEEHRQRLAWFDERYEIISGGHLGLDNKRSYLGNNGERTCRYCGNAEPEVTFKQIAHAFPEQIGNKNLIDLMECDTCNSRFAKMVDDEFAKWTHPWRTMGRIYGANGVPTLKSGDKKVRVAGKSTKDLEISVPAGDPRHEFNIEEKTFRLDLERQPYVPMGVFKCLVKMALSVMPPKEAIECSHLKQWILEPIHTFESYPYRPLNILFQAISGPFPNDRITYSLLRRKPEVGDCPFMVFVLQFWNTIYQIALPMHIHDRALLNGSPFSLCWFPHPGGLKQHVSAFGSSTHKVYDMSGTDAVKGDVERMNFHYDHVEEFSDTASVERNPSPDRH